VLLDVEQGLCFSLNPVGARIWEMVTDGHSLDEITNILEVEFRLPHRQLHDDVANFLKQLEEAKLLGEQLLPRETPGIFQRLLARNRSV